VTRGALVVTHWMDVADADVQQEIAEFRGSPEAIAEARQRGQQKRLELRRVSEGRCIYCGTPLPADSFSASCSAETRRAIARRERAVEWASEQFPEDGGAQ
jgi:hypothetical protein